MSPQVVEIASIAFPGTRGVAWSSFDERDDAPLKNLLALLNELVEDRVWRTTFRARDLIDATRMLLEALEALGPGAEAGVWEAVERHGLGREWAELTTFLAGLRLLPEGFTDCGRPWTVRGRLASWCAAHSAGPVAGAVGWVQDGWGRPAIGPGPDGAAARAASVRSESPSNRPSAVWAADR